MSTYYNHEFIADPFTFVKKYSVDIKTWFENLNRSNTRATDIGRALVTAADAVSSCTVDFEPVGGLMGFMVDTVQLRFAPTGIPAYWAPYFQGHGLPGHVDVLRRDPPVKYIFTAGMNGCAFVVTDSPKGPAYMRVYHNQHPGAGAGCDAAILNIGQPVIGLADFTEYGGQQLGPGVNPIAFNFLYYRNSNWNFVFQPQQFNALSLAPPTRQPGQESMRSVL